MVMGTEHRLIAREAEIEGLRTLVGILEGQVSRVREACEWERRYEGDFDFEQGKAEFARKVLALLDNKPYREE